MSGHVAVDLFARDLRMLRAAREVLATYTIKRKRSAKDKPITFRVKGVGEPYDVVATTDWSAAPFCNCPDAHYRFAIHGGFCKHVIAVLLNDDELRCQLLDIFL